MDYRDPILQLQANMFSQLTSATEELERVSGEFKALQAAFEDSIRDHQKEMDDTRAVIQTLTEDLGAGLRKVEVLRGEIDERDRRIEELQVNLRDAKQALELGLTERDEAKKEVTRLKEGRKSAASNR